MKPMHLKKVFLLAIAYLLFGACSTVLAHKPSDSYLRLSEHDSRLQVEWDIAIKDLDFVLDLDQNRDGQVTWGEVRSKRQSIQNYALGRLQIRGTDQTFEASLQELMINRHSDGAYVVLVFLVDCPGDAAQLEVNYDLLFDVDPTHRGLLLDQRQASSLTTIFRPASRKAILNLTEDVSLFAVLMHYVQEGVWHIWIGFDHILFLISLLLPAVLVKKEDGWSGVKSFRSTSMTVVKIVTVFTVAHSITLWLAVMEYVTLPSQWIEATIAFSIVLTALNNLYPVLPLSSKAIAFVFGLVHGFGFANVLLDLGLSQAALAISLFGFNVGVELGQLVIVLVFLPIAFLMRESQFYRAGMFQFGSVAIASLASIWLYERICNVEILGI